MIFFPSPYLGDILRHVLLRKMTVEAFVYE